MALTAGILGLQRTCDSLISTLCRLTVPQWHGQDLFPPPQESNTKERPQSISRTVSESGGATSTATTANTLDGVTYFRWRHVQALIRLTQVVHVLADVITDWEVIVDSFEQLILLLLTSTYNSNTSQSTNPANSSSVSSSNTGSSAQKSSSASTTSAASSSSSSNFGVVIHDELTSMDVDRIFECIERFKGFTVFISDESLMRLMTSLVALSLNSLANSPTSLLLNQQGGMNNNNNGSNNNSSNNNNSNSNNNTPSGI